MKRHSDIDCDSGVVAYEIVTDFIRDKFSDGAVYLYYNERWFPPYQINVIR